METIETDEAAALKKKISHNSSRITAEIRAEIGELEEQYVIARKEQKLGMFLIVVTFLLGHLLSFISGGTFIVLVYFGLFIYGLYKGFKLAFGKVWIIKKYNVTVNKVIFNHALALAGLTGQMKEDGEEKLSQMEILLKQGFLKSRKDVNSPETIIIFDDLAKSELITEEHNTNQVDNIIEVNYKDSVIRIAELDIKRVSGSGKNRQTNYIFHGYFVGFELKKEMIGKTFVSTEGDKHGFGHISTFGISSDIKARETMLEWNDFENLLHVATTDEVEARYILTPDFMQDLYNWWQGRKTNIRLSFINNRLYILYPDNNIRLNHTVKKITDEAIAEYIFTIIWPIQNVMKLIDDVRL